MSIVPRDPAEDLRKLCDAWRDYTGAKWAWLWLFHPDNGGEVGHWELTSVDTKGMEKHYVLGDLTPSDADCTVAELANTIRLPIFVHDLNAWAQQWKTKSYRVVCAKELTSLGCNSLLCIPLIAPATGASEKSTPTTKYIQPVKAAICAHFDAETPIKSEGTSPLGLMGQVSSHFISSVYDAEEHRIVTKMNEMAARFLTRRRTNRRAADERREHLEEVIKLVCERLHLQYASIFYRNESKRLIYCVATNSLFDSEGRPLMNEERLLRKAVYSSKEGLTGKVFATGKPYIHRIGQPASRPKYKFRETPLEIPESELAWVIYPIISATSATESPSRPDVLGVIRCVGTEARIVSGRRRNLDPLQIHTLDFIVKMLAPVMETMAATIERERVISIIKHDLFAPLKMCRDFVKKAAIQIEEGKPLHEHFIPNLQFCIHVARSLAAGLDQSPTDIREFNPVPSKMEADIVAGIKNMLNPHAMMENSMRIQTGDIKGVFPEYINVDRDLISRALCNLILNAVKYGETGSTISVVARQDDAGYYLLVQNKGEPIPEVERERIFEEGYRSEKAISKKFGLGMGLPIARAIMHRHDGALKLVPSSDQTVFSMFFPKHLKC